jgi:hypothetical protein
MAAHYKLGEKGNFTVTYDTPEENPAYLEDGQCIETGAHWVVLKQLTDLTPDAFWNAGVHQVIARLHELAKEKLGPGRVYEIRGKIPTNYGRSRGLAWYTSHWMQEETETRPFEAIDYPGRVNELGGDMFLGRFKT